MGMELVRECYSEHALQGAVLAHEMCTDVAIFHEEFQCLYKVLWGVACPLLHRRKLQALEKAGVYTKIDFNIIHVQQGKTEHIITGI